jgi:hypothetical protein
MRESPLRRSKWLGARRDHWSEGGGDSLCPEAINRHIDEWLVERGKQENSES